MNKSAPRATETATIIHIDAVVNPELLSHETVHLLDTFAPFGESNRRPRFLVKDLPLSHWRIVGKSGEHVKFVWSADGEPLEGIGFGLAATAAALPQNAVVDVVGALEVNEWQGQRRFQLAVEDVAPAGTVRIIHGE